MVPAQRALELLSTVSWLGLLSTLKKPAISKSIMVSSKQAGHALLKHTEAGTLHERFREMPCLNLQPGLPDRSSHWGKKAGAHGKGWTDSCLPHTCHFSGETPVQPPLQHIFLTSFVFQAALSSSGHTSHVVF